MNFKSKLPLFFLFLSVLLTSTLALRFPNQQDPQSELRQCMRRCQSQQGGVQRQCMQECHEVYRERQEGERGRRWVIEQGNDELINPERQYEQCQHQCQRQGRRGQGQKWQCQRRCQEEYQQEREGGRGGRYVVEEDNQGDDPGYEECLPWCQMHRAGEPWQRECRRKCHEEFERERQRGRQYVNEVDDNEDSSENQGHYRECEIRCQKKEGGPWDCQKKCQERFEQQRGRRGHGHAFLDSENQGRDPYLLSVCQQRCQGQRGGQQYECQRRCLEECEEERGRGGRYIEEESKNSDRHSPQQQDRECQQRCQRQGQGRECQRRCQEEFQRQGGRGGPPSLLEVAGML